MWPHVWPHRGDAISVNKKNHQRPSIMTTGPNDPPAQQPSSSMLRVPGSTTSFEAQDSTRAMARSIVEQTSEQRRASPTTLRSMITSSLQEVGAAEQGRTTSSPLPPLPFVKEMRQHALCYIIDQALALLLLNDVQGRIEDFDTKDNFQE